MLIYNTTFHVDDDILEDSLIFLKKVYIPQALVSGHLSSPRLAYIHHQAEEGGTNYSLQFCVDNIDVLNNWLQTDGHILQQKIGELFKNKMLGFNTLLEEVDINQ